MKTITKRAAHIALLATVTVAICLFLFVAVGPRTGTYRTLTVLSASMRPTFEPGSIVIATPTPVTELAIGDVITYRIPVEDHRVVTHRIVEIVETGDRPVVRTQGDANNAADPWLARLEGEVAWRTEASVPALGYAISALREPLVARALVLLCPLLLCMLWLSDIWRRSDAEAEHLAISEPEPVEAILSRRQARPIRQTSNIDTALALASGADRVLRWTDDFVSGRRPRRQALRA